MAEVKITIIGEDKGGSQVFNAVEKAGTSAMDKLKSAATSVTASIKSHWMEISAAGVAAWMAIGKAMDYAKLGAAAMQAEESYKNVANAYGEDADKLLAKMKEVSAGIIDDSDLMQRSVKALQQGLSGNQIVDLLEVARSSARVAGLDIAAAFDLITTATATQMTRGLKALGIVIDQNKAFEAYAGQLGVTKDALTEMQQSQALANAAIEEGKRQLQAMGGITDNASEKIQRAEAQLHELKETIGKGLLVAVQAIGGAFYWLAGGAMVAASGAMALGAGILIAAGRVQEGKALWQDAKVMFEAAGETAAKGMKLWEGMGVSIDGANEKLKGSALASRLAAEEAQALEYKAKKEAAAMKDLTVALADFDNKVRLMDPSLDATTKQITQFWQETEKLIQKVRESEGLTSAEKLAAESTYMKGFDQAVEYIRLIDERKKAEDEAKTAFEKAHASVIAKMEAEKAQFTDLIEYAKDYRNALVKTYEDAIAKANEFYTRSTAIGAALAKGKDFLAGLNAKPMSAADQMQKERESLNELLTKTRRSDNENDVISTMQKVETFLIKYKGTKDILGFSVAFDDLKESYGGLLHQLEGIQGQVDRAGDAWVSASNRQISAIQAVDEWMQYLTGHVKDLDIMLAETKEVKIDTSMAVAQINGLIQQVLDLQNIMAGSEQAYADSPAGTYNNTTPTGALNNSGVIYVEPTFNPDSQAWADWASQQNWTQEVTLDFYGKGSARKPLTEKITDYKSDLADLTKGSAYTLDMTQMSGAISKIMELRGMLAASIAAGPSFTNAANVNRAYLEGMLGSYETGTEYVPRTGPYILHQGEKVTPAGGKGGDQYFTVDLSPTIYISGEEKSSRQTSREIQEAIADDILNGRSPLVTALRKRK